MDYNDYVNNNDDDLSHDHDDCEDDEIYELVVFGCYAAVTYYFKYVDKQPCKYSKQTGSMWKLHCLTGNESICHENFRMKSRVFFQLCNVLQHTYGLQHTKRMRVEELVGICFLDIVIEWFKKDSKILARLYMHFHKILKCLNKMSMDVLKHSYPTLSAIPTHIQNSCTKHILRYLFHAFSYIVKFAHDHF